MTGPDRQGPGPTDTHPPQDYSPSHGGHDRKGNRGADPALVDFVSDIAGDGTVDERCARILRAFSPLWFGVEYDNQEHER